MPDGSGHAAAGELAGRPGGIERLDETDERAVVHAPPRLGGGNGQADRQTGLTHPRGTQEDHVLLALDEGELVQALDLLATDRGLKGEVELLQRLDRRQS